MDQLTFTLISEGRPYKFTGNTPEEVTDRAFPMALSIGMASNRDELYNRVKAQIAFTKQEVTISKRTPTFFEMKSAGLALFQFSRGEHEGQTEVNRRSNICKACPMMTESSFCSACGGLTKFTKLLNEVKILTGKKIRFDEYVKTRYCGICGCSLPLLLVTKVFPVELPEKNAERPDQCWLKVGGINYKLGK